MKTRSFFLAALIPSLLMLFSSLPLHYIQNPASIPHANSTILNRTRAEAAYGNVLTSSARSGGLANSTQYGVSRIFPNSTYKATKFIAAAALARNSSAGEWQASQLENTSTPCGLRSSYYTGTWATNSLSGAGPEALVTAGAKTNATQIFHCPLMLVRTGLQNGASGNLATYNWGGYVVATNFSNPQPNITAINGSWVVQTAAPSNSPVYSSQWIGIGGFFDYGNFSDYTLIQDGTSSEYDTSTSGKPSYYAWYELLPQGSVELSTTSYPVAPNDIINTSIHLISGNTWNITIRDHNKTKNWTYSKVVVYNSSKLSAEMIDERPEICYFFCSLTNLSDFGIARFGNDYSKVGNTIYVAMNGISKPIGAFNYKKVSMLTSSGTQYFATPLNMSSDNTSFEMMFGPIIAPSPAASDSGVRYINLTATAGGGPYSYRWYVNGNGVGANSDVLRFNWNASTNASTNYVYVDVLNYTTNALVARSLNDTVMQNSPMATPNITSSANVVDAGQFFFINATDSGGTPPYLYNFTIYSTSSTQPFLNGAFYGYNTISVYAIIYPPGNYFANVVVSDSASPAAVRSSQDTNIIHINRQPTLYVSALNMQTQYLSYIDEGEVNTINYTATVRGGTGPYTINFLNGGFNVLQSNSLLPIGGEANYDLNVNSIGTYSLISEATDTGTTSPYYLYSYNYTIVNPALAKPTIMVMASNTGEYSSSHINASKLDYGQYIYVNSTETGGTSPYTYNFIVSNAVTNSVVNSILASSSAYVQNSSTSQAFVKLSPGTYRANVVVTDSSDLPENSVSASSNEFTIFNAPSISLIPNSLTLQNGQNETYTITVYNGVGPFIVGLYNVGNGLQLGSNMIIASGGTNTISFNVSSKYGSILTYNAVATDTGTSVPFTFNSVQSEIAINPLYRVPSFQVSPHSPLGNWISFAVQNTVSMTVPVNALNLSTSGVETLFSIAPTIPLGDLASESFTITTSQQSNIIGFNGVSGTAAQSPVAVLLVQVGSSTANGIIVQLTSSNTLFSYSGNVYTGTPQTGWEASWYEGNASIDGGVVQGLQQWADIFNANYMAANVIAAGIEYGFNNNASSGTIYLGNVVINDRSYVPIPPSSRNEVPIITSNGLSPGGWAELNNSLGWNGVQLTLLPTNYTSSGNFTFYALIGSVLNGAILRNTPAATKSLQTYATGYAFPETNSISASVNASPYSAAGSVPMSTSIVSGLDGGGVSFASFSNGSSDNLLRLTHTQLPGLTSSYGSSGESESLWLTGFPVFDQASGVNNFSVADAGGAYEATFNTPIQEYSSAGSRNLDMLIKMLGQNVAVLSENAPTANIVPTSVTYGGGITLADQLLPMATVYLDHNVTNSSVDGFNVELTGIGTPVNGLSNASIEVFYKGTLTNTTQMQPYTIRKFDVSGNAVFVRINQTLASPAWAQIQLFSNLFNLTNGKSFNQTRDPGWNVNLMWTNTSSSGGTSHALAGLVVWNESPTSLLPGQSFNFIGDTPGWKVKLESNDLIDQLSGPYSNMSFSTYNISGFLEFFYPYQNPAQKGLAYAVANVYNYNALGFAATGSNELLNTTAIVEPQNLLDVISDYNFNVTPVESGRTIYPTPPNYVLYNLDTYELSTYNALSQSAAINLSADINAGVVIRLLNNGLSANYLSSTGGNITIDAASSQAVAVVAFNAFNTNATERYVVLQNVSEILLGNDFLPPGDNAPPYPGITVEVYDTSNVLSPAGNSILLGKLTYAGPYLMYYATNKTSDRLYPYFSTENAMSANVVYNPSYPDNGILALSRPTTSNTARSAYYTLTLSQPVLPGTNLPGANIILQLTNSSHPIDALNPYLLNYSSGFASPFAYQSSQSTTLAAASRFRTESGTIVGTTDGIKFFGNESTSNSFNATASYLDVLPYLDELSIGVSPSNATTPATVIGTDVLFNASAVGSLSNVSSMSYAFYSNSTEELGGISGDVSTTLFPILIINIGAAHPVILRPLSTDLYSAGNGMFIGTPAEDSWIVTLYDNGRITAPLQSINSTPHSLYYWSHMLQSLGYDPTVSAIGVGEGFSYLKNESTIVVKNVTLNNVTYGIAYNSITQSSAVSLLNASSTKSSQVNLSGDGTMLRFSTNVSNTIPIRVAVYNLTSASLPPIAGLTRLVALNFYTTSPYNKSLNITISATVRYPCSAPAGEIAPYVLTNGSWTKVSAYNVSSSACTVEFSIPADPVIGIFQSAQSSGGSAGGGSGGGGSGGGGGGVGGGGGGQFLPTVVKFNTSNETGYKIYNFTQDNQEKVGINGTIFTIVENFISPDQAGISVNGDSYTLSDGEIVSLTGHPGYHLGLLNISYLPIINLVNIEIYESISSPPKANNTVVANTIKPVNTVPTNSINTTKHSYNNTAANATATVAKHQNPYPILPYALAAAVIVVVAVTYLIYRNRKQRAPPEEPEPPVAPPPAGHQPPPDIQGAVQQPVHPPAQ